MAFDVSAISTFTEKSNDVLYNGILTGPALTNYQLVNGINGSQFVNFVDVTAYEQSSNCALATSGSTTLTQKTLTVGDFTFVNDLCMRDIDGYAFPTVAGLVYDTIEARLMDSIIMDTYQKIKRRVDLNLWVGTTAGGYLINGFVYQVSACTSRTMLTTYTATNLALTAATVSTIDDVFNEFLTLMTQDMTVNGPLVINVPWEYYNLYSLWRANNTTPQTMADIGAAGVREQWLVGREDEVMIRVQPGLVDTDYMFMTYDKNLAIGTDVASEATNLSNAHFEYDNITRKLYHFVDFRLGCLVINCDKVVANF